MTVDEPAEADGTDAHPADDLPEVPEEFRMRFFGRRWNAPAFDDAIEVPVPLGATCLFCTELVDEHDSGILQAAYLETGPTVVAIHIECHLRSVFGCVPHLEHRCSCFGGGDHDGTSREDARAVLAWVIAEQSRRGIVAPGFVE